MNIKQCKEEIKNTIQAYLSKDESGEYKIPVKNQRPMLLIGPPGIGKTAIMEQIANECKIGMVGYTITHHTRQSAIGLPKIETRSFEGEAYDVTEYTMSEIIASVYEKMEQTGLSEGILFLDEINCVSETLAPTMLQFLQNKMFGNHSVPKGWVIVAAGNPPEYNKSVREFDIVTLDRVRQMNVVEDYTVWKEYAYKNRVHNAILSYLDLRRENFYRVETTVDGKRFVTARGWEDLSFMIYAYEELGLAMTSDVVYGYIQHEKTARDFTNYLELYYKYKEDYRVDQILNGHFSEAASQKLSVASFDEKLSVIGLLLGKLNSNFMAVSDTEGYIDWLYAALLEIKAQFGSTSEEPFSILDRMVEQKECEVKKESLAGLMTKDSKKAALSGIITLKQYEETIYTHGLKDHEMAFAKIKETFAAETKKRQNLIEQTKNELDQAFVFMEQCFGSSQEMVVFVTELTANYYSMKFIRMHGCDRYYAYNQSLLFTETRNQLLDEIKEVRSLKN